MRGSGLLVGAERLYQVTVASDVVETVERDSPPFAVAVLDVVVGGGVVVRPDHLDEIPVASDVVEPVERRRPAFLAVTDASIDMGAAFEAGIKANFENAEITFDKFHVIKLANEAVDEVRRQEAKNNFQIKGRRYIFLKNVDRLTQEEKEALSRLEAQNLDTIQAMQIRMNLLQLFTMSAKSARRFLDRWNAWVQVSDLAPMKKLAKTIMAKSEGILRSQGRPRSASPVCRLSAPCAPDNEDVAASGVLKRLSVGGALHNRAGHLLNGYLDAPRLFECVLLQGQILVERRDSRIAELGAQAVNLAILPRPRVPLRLRRSALFGLSS